MVLGLDVSRNHARQSVSRAAHRLAATGAIELDYEVWSIRPLLRARIAMTTAERDDAEELEREADEHWRALRYARLRQDHTEFERHKKWLDWYRALAGFHAEWTETAVRNQRKRAEQRRDDRQRKRTTG